MNNTSLSMTIVASSLIASSAMADYTGLSFEGVSNGDGTWTARIYADFSAETDQLNAVFGDPDDALLITSTNGFYQNALGGATSASINPAFIPLFPSLALDSWVTIGLEDQTGNNMLNIGIDWSDFESGNDISTNNGAWFATPADAQVLAGSDLRVLVGQFTMLGLDSHLSGVLNLQGYQGDFEPFQARNQTFVFPVPAPGAIALLSIAGLASRRRRI
jgi:hypothetical protein